MQQIRDFSLCNFSSFIVFTFFIVFSSLSSRFVIQAQNAEGLALGDDWKTFSPTFGLPSMPQNSMDHTDQHSGKSSQQINRKTVPFVSIRQRFSKEMKKIAAEVKKLKNQMERPFKIIDQLKPSQEICKDYLNYERLSKVRIFSQVNGRSKNSDLALEEKNYYQNRYNISVYPELPFCIVVPTYNNVAGQRYLKNINSILQQDYSNYKVIIIDDASTDGTGNLIKEFIANYRISSEKIKLKINTVRLRALPNILQAAHQFCKPFQIMIIVDGDDELLGRQVFKHFNMMYQHEDVWIAYTNFLSSQMIRSQSLSLGFSKSYHQMSIQLNSYRKQSFLISHLRSFVTKLLTLIKQEDLKDQNGNWFRAANDVAIYLPMLEMSHKRVLYCPEISYIYNSNTGMNNHLTVGQQQKNNDKKIRLKKNYDKLNSLLTKEQIISLRKSVNINIEIIDSSLPKPEVDPIIMGWQI